MSSSNESVILATVSAQPQIISASASSTSAVHRVTELFDRLDETLDGCLVESTSTLLPECSAPLNLDEVRVDPKWAAKVPAAFAIRRKLLPLCKLDENIIVAIAHGMEATIESALTNFLGNKFIAIEAEPQSLQRAITRIYGTLASSFQAEKQRKLDREDQGEVRSNSAMTLCDKMIQAAMQQNASYIHSVPGEKSLKILFRVDGVLETYRDISNELQLSLAQRLVRSLCSHCKAERPLTNQESIMLRCPELAGSSVYEPSGCVYCAGRGYTKRIALFEMMSCNEHVSSAIARGADENELWNSALQSRRSSLMDDGVAKLLTGVTSVDEVMSAVATWVQP